MRHISCSLFLYMVHRLVKVIIAVLIVYSCDGFSQEVTNLGPLPPSSALPTYDIKGIQAELLRLKNTFRASSDISTFSGRHIVIDRFNFISQGLTGANNAFFIKDSCSHCDDAATFGLGSNYIMMKPSAIENKSMKFGPEDLLRTIDFTIAHELSHIIEKTISIEKYIRFPYDISGTGTNIFKKGCYDPLLDSKGPLGRSARERAYLEKLAVTCRNIRHGTTDIIAVALLKNLGLYTRGGMADYNYAIDLIEHRKASFLGATEYSLQEALEHLEFRIRNLQKLFDENPEL
jgi:hypothetical protein